VTPVELGAQCGRFAGGDSLGADGVGAAFSFLLDRSCGPRHSVVKTGATTP
jgi:hypothetical protein